SLRAIHAALDAGINLFDTANVYGAGHSERVLGQALAGKRDKAVIATKFNAVFDETTRQVTGSDKSPAGIRAACDASLRRLNTDYIDLYQFHDGGFPVDQAEPVRATLEALVSEGKIRAYGWSTDYPDGARVFAEGEHCTAIQHEINVFDDNAPMIALCEELNLASINRGPLAMGLLTGKFNANSQLAANDVRGQSNLEWLRYFADGKPRPDFLQKLDAIRDILSSGGRTLAQGALAWLWARSPQNVPIPGFRSVTQVEENTGAMQFGPLSADAMAEIDGILERQPA
ncbi:MAG: aldo/keto reductase, partial [Burkholderiales bacterium]|nr:aldo/keto reductase [Anaerolineae bacterium]